MKINNLSEHNCIINRYLAEMRDCDYQKNRLLFRNNIMRIGEYEAFEISKTLNYEQIMTEGITRKVGNHTIRYKGEEAVRIQIESLRKRASKSYQAQAFIDNYTKTLSIAGLEPDQIDSIEKLLNKSSIVISLLSSNFLNSKTLKLSYLI